MGMRFNTLMSAPRLVPVAALSASAARTHKILLGIDARGTRAAPDRAVVARRDRHLVAQIDELKASLQLVIAIRPAADDVQKQIELRRRGPGPWIAVPWHSLRNLPAIHRDAHARIRLAQHHARG